jgi:hypothetical protein
MLDVVIDEAPLVDYSRNGPEKLSGDHPTTSAQWLVKNASYQRMQKR